MDVTAVVTAIDGIATPVGLVGAAFLTLAAVVVGWRWLRGFTMG